MRQNGSTTHWIEAIKQGDSLAASALWNRYFTKLVDFARLKLMGRPRRVADEEDVALCAFNSFCLAARQGRFPDLADREGLWLLLLRITARKAVDLIRYNHRDKRRVLGESAIKKPGEESEFGGVEQVIGEAPTPDFAAMVAEECSRLLDGLKDQQLKDLAIKKMEGWKNEELAKQRDCSLRTVERQLQLIRKAWESKTGVRDGKEA